MSERIFPLLYINMAGEMMYILEQRLRVQKENLEDRQKSDKVLKDITLQILSKSTLDEVFRASVLPQKKNLKNLFEKLAHVSIMRLNENSMDKLFDLMTMTTKYQIQKVTMAEQILTVTVNHLQGFQDMLTGDSDIKAVVEHAYTMTLTLYRIVTPYGWHMIRSGLLAFFQGPKVKISMLLREQRQMPDGNFVLYPENEPVQLPKDIELLGYTKYFENGTITHASEIPIKFKFTPFENFPDGLNVPQRSTKLGQNMYKNTDSMKIQGGGGAAQREEHFQEGNEMAFFESIMPNDSSAAGGDIVGMSLFDDETEEKKYVKASEEMRIQRIDAAANKMSLKDTVNEKIKSRPSTADKNKDKKKSKGASVLDLMDEAAARPPTAKPKSRRSESSGAASTTTRPRSKSGARGERAPSAAPRRAASAKRKPEK